MESVAAIFSLVAGKRFGACKDPVCENVSIFRRLSQSASLSQQKSNYEKASEDPQDQTQAHRI
ncbi:MAG TPA: hypothetical protein V6D04_08865 [Candidatus Obscuribacterales bacterium]|jgi:hypothetical protein